MNKSFLVLFFLLLFIQKDHGQTLYPLEVNWHKTYDTKFYFLNLQVNDSSTYVKGNSLIKILINEPTDSICFDFNSELKIDSVQIGSIKVSSKFIGDLLVVKSSEVLASGLVKDVNVFYSGNVSKNSFFSSVTNENDRYWNIPVTWSLSEPFGAKNWFPCKQQLSDKADSCWVFLTVPKGKKAGSTGLLTQIAPLANDKVQFQWKTRYPIAFYLISFTVADYQDYSYYAKIDGRSDSLLVQNFIYNRPGYLENNKAEIDKTESFINLYSKLFGLYPFYKEKYGHCVAPIGGGMEHQTMTTLMNFNYTLVSHELAHQWFGDNTTCASWQDIWVNEGFASYGEYLAYEFLNTKAEANSWMGYAQTRSLREAEGSVFIPLTEAEDENRIFSTNLSYKKGAVIIHMLRKQINNDSLFFKSLRTYLSKYRYSTATGDDFKKVVEQETRLNLDKFFNQWYYGKGYPIFDVSWKQSGDTLLLNVNQTTSSKSTPLFTTPFDIKIFGSDSDTIIRLEQTTNMQVFKIKFRKTVNSIEFDPDKWLLKVLHGITKLPEIPSDDQYFEVKPNPFRNNLFLTFKNESAKDEKVKIMNLNGMVVLENFARKKKEFTINTEELKPGTYLLIVSHGQEKYVRKIIKSSI